MGGASEEIDVHGLLSGDVHTSRIFLIPTQGIPKYCSSTPYTTPPCLVDSRRPLSGNHIVLRWKSWTTYKTMSGGDWWLTIMTDAIVSAEACMARVCVSRRWWRWSHEYSSEEYSEAPRLDYRHLWNHPGIVRVSLLGYNLRSRKRHEEQPEYYHSRIRYFLARNESPFVQLLWDGTVR